MRPIRPDDDFLLLTDTVETPMQIGSLQFYEAPEGERSGFLAAVRAQFAERLPLTPLLAVRHSAPDLYDSDVWLEVAACDLDQHVVAVDSANPMTRQDVYAFVEKSVMERLDLSRPPFQAYVMSNLAEGGCALFMKVHHAVADGVGFQTILSKLTDERPDAPRLPAGLRQDEVPPDPATWRAQSEARFEAEAPLRAAFEAQRAEAIAALSPYRKDPAKMRAETPVLKLSGPTSSARAYETLSLPLARFRDTGHRLGGTVNDVFQTIASSALRRYLLEIDDLPATPLVVNSARSYRRPEHGEYGNRITALHPHLATDLADPLARFSAIQASMALERERSPLEEKLLGAPETPFGPRSRREAMAKRAGGARVLPGNITLSNVPGPDGPRYLAGYRQKANYPTPVLGSGRFLNLTMRRNADMLDMGIMADRQKLPDVGRIRSYLADALDELESLAAQTPKAAS